MCPNEDGRNFPQALLGGAIAAAQPLPAPSAVPPAVSTPPAAATPASTAAPSPRETPLPTYTESAGSEYVLLPVLVFDRKGRFVDGLAKADFRVNAGGVNVTLDTFERDDDAPASFAFLVDTSGSMKIAGKLESAKSAIRHILEGRRSGDDFALFAFSENELSLLSEFSPDPSRISRALTRLEAGGRTALFDAVAATPSRMLAGKNGKRAILLFTDGVDNASRLSADEMATILQQVSIPVYAVGMKNAAFDRLSDAERKDLALDNLKLLAYTSGGQLYLANGEEDLRPIAARINTEVRKQYLLGFAPSGQGELKYRVVVVSVTKPGKWVVRTRRGYRGTVPAPAG
ncbi:MAG: VWA domain-containing protein [Acidobacteria bacterium]|nr:VWA domain-containing protein [Acidobacteriota bacterium]